MKRTRVVQSTVSALIVGILAICQAHAQMPAVAAKDRVVVLISLDGIPGFVFEDPKLPIPTLRKLAREGATARSLRPPNPSQTFPSHMTMITGQPPAVHHVMVSGLLVHPGSGLPVKVDRDKDNYELIRIPTIYDVAYRAGLTTAQVGWFAINGAKTINWAFPRVPDINGAVEKEMIAGGVIGKSDLEEFPKGSRVWCDQQWTNAAAHLLTRHKPNLLLFHLDNADFTNHRHGPRSAEAYTAYAYADAAVKQIVESLETGGLRDRATLLVVSDHGFKDVQRNISTNAVLRQHGLLKREGERITCDAFGLPHGGVAMIYVTRPEQRAELIPRLKRLFEKTEGVDRVFEAADYAALGMPTPQQTDQAPDLVLAAKPGYQFAGVDDGGAAVVAVPPGTTIGGHGYLNSDPEAGAMFLAWGYGIRPGARVEQVDMTDVAPTIAALLGLRMEGVAGKAVRAILK